jgi:hypothetical protein
MSIGTAIGDLIHSIYELFSSILGGIYNAFHAIFAAIFGLFNGLFVLIGDVFKGAFDVVGGVGKFLISKSKNAGSSGQAGLTHTRQHCDCRHCCCWRFRLCPVSAAAGTTSRCSTAEEDHVGRHKEESRARREDGNAWCTTVRVPARRTV